MSYFPAYRLFQGNEIINAVSFLNCKSDIEWRQKRKKDSELKLGQPKKDAKKNVQNLTAELKLQTSQTILTSIIKLNPKEIKNFSTILIWDKNRYSQYFDSEYYLGEREIHYLDFNLNLMKEELKEKVTPEVFKTIMEDKTIIKGWIQSNKMEIYFKE
ncbi:MAG: hypothetical protein GZ087_04845 [Flavobacterium sp.]|nr:hypothetical protein [Flavobacterium sp.]